MTQAIMSEESVADFVEEAGEIFQALDNRLPVWRKLPTDRDALVEIRRAFHTLKGSGRMVNALDLADVAWKVENMLNRVLDGSIQATKPVVELVSTARELMPRMLDAFENRRSMQSDSEVESLMARAGALAAGRAPAPAQPTLAAATPEGAQRQSREPAMLARLQKRSDEALHRSEMGLQLARRLAAHIGAMKEEARDRVSRAEANLVVERLDRLSADVRALTDTKPPQPEQPPNRHEVGQLVDQLIRERVASIERELGLLVNQLVRVRVESIERGRSDLERRLEEAYRTANSSRNLVRLALTFSFLAGTGAIAALLM